MSTPVLRLGRDLIGPKAMRRVIPSGATHCALEDVTALRTLPGLTVAIPATSSQAAAALSVAGGLGSFVATAIAPRGRPCRLRILAAGASPDGTSGSKLDRWRKHGLDSESIVRNVLEAIHDQPPAEIRLRQWVPY